MPVEGIETTLSPFISIPLGTRMWKIAPLHTLKVVNSLGWGKGAKDRLLEKCITPPAAVFSALPRNYLAVTIVFPYMDTIGKGIVTSI